MDTNILSLLKSPQDDSGQDHFRHFARPLNSRLLEAMEMAKDFHHGEGDYLFYLKNGKNERVLDLTGGYGANLLGHRHPKILAKLNEWTESGSPNHTQDSLRSSSGNLAKRLSDTLSQESGEGPWITTFSNSGTESIEAAIKHTYLYYQHRMTKLSQEVEKEINQAMSKLKRMPEAELSKVVRKLRVDLTDKIVVLKMSEERKSYFLHQLNNVHTIEELSELIRLINGMQLSQKPLLVALERACHGKSMGALALTFNPGLRHPFYLDASNNRNVSFLSPYTDAVKLNEYFQTTLLDLVLLSNTPKGVVLTKQAFSLVAGAFVEPIQSEAGVIPVASEFLAFLKKHSLQEDFLLIFDETQSGMYRTGRLAAGSHSDITPDIYTFSKSLGGGVAKIAATCIIQRRYIEEFGFLHTSTLSEDDLSSVIALEVLNLLQAENSPLNEGMKVAHYLEARLEWIKNLYPDVIKEIRGKGLMLAIEFEDTFLEFGFEFKSICDARMQGYMLASALLNHESIRISPTLSNNLSLRIQPSIYLDLIQVEELVTGLINLCHAIKTRNIKYFMSALYPSEEILNEVAPAIQSKIKLGDRPISVFLCHMIDEGHIKKVTKALKQVPGDKLLKKLALAKDIADFTVYHAQTITDNNGQEMDVVLLGIAVTSEELKKTFISRNKYKIVNKVQGAVDFAKSIGANTVGLGQFTSIVSGNGLYLNPRGMNITTGNAYTISLTVQSALRSAHEKKVHLPTATVALIGAAGNIMSVASSLMADEVGKVILIHHSPIDSSSKFQQTTKRILDEIAQSERSSPVVDAIKKIWNGQNDLLKFLELPEIQSVFVATSDLNEIKEAEIVLCGASASNGFLNLELFKQNAVVVDVAVPPTIKPELLAMLETTRPDLTYHLGGVAQIPQGHSIDFYVFPLGVNECYACMAETFSIGFSNQKNFMNIGDLNKAIVNEVKVLADRAGFILGSYKSKSSL